MISVHQSQSEMQLKKLANERIKAIKSIGCEEGGKFTMNIPWCSQEINLQFPFYFLSALSFGLSISSCQRACIA